MSIPKVFLTYKPPRQKLEFIFLFEQRRLENLLIYLDILLSMGLKKEEKK